MQQARVDADADAGSQIRNVTNYEALLFGNA